MTHGKFNNWVAAAALLFTLSIPAAALQTGAAVDDSERGKQLLAQGRTLLSLYVNESTRADEKHPMPKDSNEETRAPVFEKREAMLAPLKARMRAAAEQLETLAESRPGGDAEARELADTLRVYGRAPGDESSRVYRQAEVTTKAMPLSRPAPEYPEDLRRAKVHGVVRLRAVLSADGKVRNILVVKRLPDGLTEKAVEAARQIKFKPATIAGRPVSQFVILEYNFNVD